MMFFYAFLFYANIIQYNFTLMRMGWKEKSEERPFCDLASDISFLDPFWP